MALPSFPLFDNPFTSANPFLRFCGASYSGPEAVSFWDVFVQVSLVTSKQARKNFARNVFPDFKLCDDSSTMDATDTDVLYSDVKAAKKLLFQSLQGTDGLQYLDEERIKIKKSFDHAFVHKLSTSLILVGRSSNECIMLVRSVLNSYTSDSFVVSSTSQRHSKIKNYTARVSGASQLSDHEALIDMANQFLLRNEKEANVNMALEDLEDHFKQCRLDGIPAIIVLEDFHAFAKRNRQTLIYTLLDLMHNKSLLFTVSYCSTCP